MRYEKIVNKRRVTTIKENNSVLVISKPYHHPKEVDFLGLVWRNN